MTTKDPRPEELSPKTLEPPKEFRVVDRRHWARTDEDDEEEGRQEKPTYVAQLEKKAAEAEGQVATIRGQFREAKSELEANRVRMRRELRRTRWLPRGRFPRDVVPGAQNSTCNS